MQYDYIIAGGGCSGLSLLLRLIQSGRFADKKILLIDRDEKMSNDRTWCFWETTAGFFEHLVYKKWLTLNFFGNDFSTTLNIAPYEYKMVRGIDFYTYAYSIIKQQRNIDIVFDLIDSIENKGDHAVLNTKSRAFAASYIFNSSLLRKLNFEKHYALQQHFKGWFIKTPQPFFTEKSATLMDFRVGQQHGTTFVYLLPFDEQRALVEYTLFTRDLLQPEEYDRALADYLKEFHQLSDYQIEEKEFGVIPMTNYPFSPGEGRIINMGTAGGQTKASSGYTFQFIQKQAQRLTEDLISKGVPSTAQSSLQKRFSFYDAVLLNILDNQKLGGREVFTDLFKNGDAQTVFKFLDNETAVHEDLKIMSRLPKMVFAKAALEELTNR